MTGKDLIVFVQGLAQPGCHSLLANRKMRGRADFLVFCVDLHDLLFGLADLEHCGKKLAFCLSRYKRHCKFTNYNPQITNKSQFQILQLPNHRSQ